ncbi:hypothetical protein GCM10022279_07600 [Comamonas faecalis]|uniref:FAD-binding FR-type domain-containing protein n=1 Tax=Comamonas faecalis TaxID=1387849 RepID=A0ABP7QRN6_9BURK
MAIYTTHLLSRTEVAQGTMAFHIEKPEGFSYKPGQAFEIGLTGLDASTPQEDVSHAFSIVAAPSEKELVFATRMRDSNFKRALKVLPIGAPLTIDGPFGSLTLHKKTERAGVLIAGGIGITPFMSMLRNAAEQQTPQDLLLLYSNRRTQDTAFLEELQQLEKRNPRFRMIATMTDPAGSTPPWTGTSGMIDADFIRKAVAGLNDPIVYISGPTPMVEAMRNAAEAAGIDEDDLRSEEFFGY